MVSGVTGGGMSEQVTRQFSTLMRQLLTDNPVNNEPKTVRIAKEPSDKENEKKGGNGQDLIFQFLTQDVSDRRIAHIVTGGLTQFHNRAI